MSGLHPFRYRILAAMLMAALSAASPAGGDAYYRVEDGKVDGKTFLGWRLFNATCVGCHGIGAVGTERAPNLVQRIGAMNPQQFELKVLHRYLISVPGDELDSESGLGVRQGFLEEIFRDQMREDGTLETMPVWETNPAVAERIDALYGYLKARADGAIGPERPELME